MSFLKFQQKNGQGGSNLHWGRAQRDGAPFQGDEVPLLRDEEFDELAERVHDCKTAMYNTCKPDEVHHGRTYQEVLDGVMANWFQLLAPRQYHWGEEEGGPVMYVFVEWAEPTIQIPSQKLQGKTTKTSVLENEVSYGGPTRRSSGNQPRPLRASK